MVKRHLLKKFIPALVTLMVLLGAASIIHIAPPIAEAVVTDYGADANPTGNPIGGGDGYVSPHGYTQAAADYVVTTVAQLSTALSSATAGQVIWIPNGTTITIWSDYGKTLKSGVVLASNRGQNGAVGGRILWDYGADGFMQPILYCQSNSVVSGLVLQGPGGICGSSGDNQGNCALRGSNGAVKIEVENCEISEFANGGIYFYGGGMAWDSSNRHRVHHCTIRNIQRDGFGYGVSEEGGCSFLVEACIFKDCRHHIMATGTYRGDTPNNYELRYNIFYDSWHWNDGDVGGKDDQQHQVDCHGSGSSSSQWSGDVLRIHHNTFSSNDCHSSPKTNVGIRGVVRTECTVYHNWTKKTTHSGLYTETYANGAFSFLDSDGGSVSGSLSSYNMSVYDNWYGSSAPPGTPENSAPAAPSTPSGPTSGFVGSAYTYQTVTTDPDWNQMRYTFDWGDGTTSTTDLADSGVTASASHTWTTAGDHWLYVQATDSHGAVSSKSSPGVKVSIAEKESEGGETEPVDTPNLSPATPSAPSGPTSGSVGSAYTYRAVTTDPDGDAIQYTIDWGDATTSTTDLVKSGVTASISHAWTIAGDYWLYVRATDSRGAVSSQSYPGLHVRINSPLQPSSGVSNTVPATPSLTSGPTSGLTSTEYQYSAVTTDADADTLVYAFSWGDGMSSTTAGTGSGVTASATHAWTLPGTYAVQVTATDFKGSVSASSSAATVTIVSQTPPAPFGTSATPSAETPGKTDIQPTPEANEPASDQEVVDATDPSSEAPAVDDGSSPASAEGEGVLPVAAHPAGFAWWVLTLVVMVGAAVLLTGAIVRETIPKPPRWHDGSGDR